MKKILPVVMVFFIYESAFALVLNGGKVVFKTDLPQKIYKSNGNQDICKLFRFKKPLTPKEMIKYRQEGIESIEYAGDLSYYFYGKKDIVERLLFKEMKLSGIGKNGGNRVTGYAELPSSSKVSRSMLYKNSNLSNSNYLVLNMILFKSLEEDSVYQKFSDIDLEILKVYSDGKSFEIKIPSSELKKLLKKPLVKYVEKKIEKIKIIDGYEDSFSKKRNLVSANMMHVKELWESPYNLLGEGIKVGVVDGGEIRATHREFIHNGSSRITVKSQNGSLSRHATHVAGTIGAEGLNPYAHGMANRSLIYSYYFNDAYFSTATYKAYAEDDIKLTNHSYGYSEKVRLGEYDYEASSQDDNIYKHPNILQFLAAGNDRGSTGYGDYGITKGPINSKNIFTIGALKDSGELAYFSSTGPVGDGRVKPDLVADGWSLYSCDSKSDDSYANMSGTSMATPSACGAAALVTESYKNKTGKNIRADILKALLFNTAEDKGREGPDYEYGFGLINAKKAVDAIKTIDSTSSLVYTNSIANDEEIVLKFYNDKSRDVRITLSWIDPAGNPSNQEKTLVNDIDMKVVGGGKVYHPYSLDKNNPTYNASSVSANHTDNSEQIEMKNLPKGEYSVILKGYLITTDKQDFAIVSSLPISSSISSIIDLNPKEISFEDIKTGSISKVKKVEVKNIGSKKLTVYNIDLLDKTNYRMDFSLANACPKSFPFTLSSSKSCEIGIIATPQSSGEIESHIKVVNDSSNDSQKDIKLSTKAVESSPHLNLYHSLEFGFESDKDIVDKESGWSIESGYLRAKEIQNSQKSDYEFKVKVYKDAQISFNYNISSELDYDYLEFYINSDEVYSDSGVKKHVSYVQSLPEGEYSFRWRYIKDYEVSLGDDTVYIDYIKITKAVFDSFVFNNTEVSKVSEPKILYISNSGLSSLKIFDIALSDENNFGLDFTKGEKPCNSKNFELKENEFCTFAVLFSPKSKGEHSTNLTINSNDSSIDKILKGSASGTSSSKTDKYLSFASFVYRTVFNIIPSSESEEIRDISKELSSGKSAFGIIKNLLESVKFKSEDVSDEKYLQIILTLSKQENENSLYDEYLKKLKDKKITRKLLRDELILKSASFKKFCEDSSITPFDEDDNIESFIERFYNYSLARQSDNSGLDYWKKSLKSKEKNGVEIGIFFFLSPEYQQRALSDSQMVESLYLTFLNREPDSAGLNYWVERMQNSLSKKDLIGGFAYSSEFSNIALEYGIEAH